MEILKQGHLIDLYEDPNGRGVIIWLIDKNGKRTKFFHRMPIPIYVDGPNELKRAIWKQLRDGSENPIHLEREIKIHPFDGLKRNLLAIYSSSTRVARQIGYQLEQRYPGIDLFDMTVEIHHRYAALYGLFPYCKLEILVDEDTKEIHDFNVKEDRWGEKQDLPVRVFEMRTDFDPLFAQDEIIYHLKSGSKKQTVDISNPRGIKNLLAFFKREDPDIIMTDFGDTFLFPYLFKSTEKYIVSFPFCRDDEVSPLIKEPMTISSYGKVMQRKQQVWLFGRQHLDYQTMPQYEEGGLDVVLETSRLSAMSLQETSRTTSGRAVASIEIIEAVKSNTVLPYKVQKVESLRSGIDFIHSDRGGLIFSPPEGVFENVLCIDFDSMFPSIMVKHNLSPETFESIEEQDAGLLPRALQPLLQRRLRYKDQIRKLDPHDCRYQEYKNFSNSIKNILIVAYGYAGFRAAPLSSPVIYEEVNRQGREAMYQAKEIAEDNGYRVLHAYIDGLFLHRFQAPSEFEISNLLQQITGKTNLPISQEGLFKWIVFLKSKTNHLITVSNAYFGAFMNGDVKVRGIECRRSDSPSLVKNFQMELMHLMAKGNSIQEVQELFPKLHGIVLRYAEDVRFNRISLKEYVVSVRLGKDLDQYKVLSHGAIAATKLQNLGMTLKAGQRIRYVYVEGREKVIPIEMFRKTIIKIDKVIYLNKLEEAAKTILLPFGSDEEYLHNLIHQSLAAKQLKMLF